MCIIFKNIEIFMNSNKEMYKYNCGLSLYMNKKNNLNKSLFGEHT